VLAYFAVVGSCGCNALYCPCVSAMGLVAGTVLRHGTNWINVRVSRGRAPRYPVIARYFISLLRPKIPKQASPRVSSSSSERHVSVRLCLIDVSLQSGSVQNGFGGRRTKCPSGVEILEIALQ